MTPVYFHGGPLNGTFQVAPETGPDYIEAQVSDVEIQPRTIKYRKTDTFFEGAIVYIYEPTPTPPDEVDK